MKNTVLTEISHRANLITTRLIESLAYELKSLHARNSAKGSLHSGATIKESSRIARTFIREYFNELERFIRECPNGSGGSDALIIDTISSSTALLISNIDEQLSATAALARDRKLVRHIKPEILEELTTSQETFRSNLRTYWLKSNAQKASPNMERLIFLFEILCFFFTVVFAILWKQNPTGNYEPLTVIFGLGGTASVLFRRYIGQKKP